MAILEIIKYPDARLKLVAKAVESFDDDLVRLVEDMKETMYDARGVGLAATQVDVQKRVVVVDVSPDKSGFTVYVNPEITWFSKEMNVYEEGCLSIPFEWEDVWRPASIRFRAQDVKGEFFEGEAEGLLATCLQHEIDHINGVLFVDHISHLKRSRILQRSKKRKTNPDHEADQRRLERREIRRKKREAASQ